MAVKWKCGKRVCKTWPKGSVSYGMFVAAWGQFAWVVWDGQGFPATELLANLVPVPMKKVNS